MRKVAIAIFALIVGFGLYLLLLFLEELECRGGFWPCSRRRSDPVIYRMANLGSVGLDWPQEFWAKMSDA
jgi:hypothetical protein